MPASVGARTGPSWRQPGISHERPKRPQVARQAELDHQRRHRAAAGSGGHRRRSRDRRSSPSAPPSSARRGSWSRTSAARRRDVAASRYRADLKRRDRTAPPSAVPNNRSAANSAALRELQIGRVDARGRECAACCDSVPMPIAFGSSCSKREQDRARSRCRDRRCAAHRSVRSLNGGERGLDHRLGFGTRHQRVRRQPRTASSRIPSCRECAPPARDRGAALRMRTMASRSSADRVRGRTGSRARRDRVASACADQQPRVELGGFDAVLAQQAGQQAPRLRDGHSGRQRFRHCHDAPVCAASCSAWCSVISASISSSSASPAMTAEVVERQADAVIGHPLLRKIVGADPLPAIARADLRAGRRPAPHLLSRFCMI